MTHGTKAAYRDGCRCLICDEKVPHGTAVGYVSWQCRCDPCRRFNTRRQKVYKLRARNGVSAWGDIDAVKSHLRNLLDDGHTYSAIASAIGWRNKSQVRDVLNGQRITYTAAQRILNLDLGRVDRDILVMSLGTTRRLRALARAGYPCNLIGDIIGFDIATLQKIMRGDQRRVRRWVADAVTGFYRQHHMTPGPSPSTARRAAAFGWHPPLAWDDADFDDPRGQARARTRIKR